MSEVIFSVDNKNVSGMIQQIVQMINKGLFIGPVEVVLRRAARSLSQNKKLWPMLNDIQKQVDWYGDNLDTDDWKVMFMASLHKQRSVPGIDGGVVGLSKRSSRLNKEEFSQLIEVIYALDLSAILLGQSHHYKRMTSTRKQLNGSDQTNPC